METANKVRNAIYPKDWAISLDLMDAYLHVPIHVTSRKYLRFCLKGRVFQFRALPFGLATSPFVFTRLMVAIATHLRVRAIILFPYLDDLLVRNQCRRELIKDKEFTLILITSLGLIINQEKSELIPSQNFIFIGMEFVTQDNTVRVPWDRVQDILYLVSWFQKQVAVTARMFLSLLGKLSASAQFVVLGRLHLRPLQMALFAQWKPHVLPLEHKIFVTEQIKHHLGWWLDRDRFIRGVVLKQSPPMHTVFTDASCSGWGAHLEPEGLMCHGVWQQDQSQLHINILEMKVILLALKEFQHILSNSSVMIATDSSSPEGGRYPLSNIMHGGMGDPPLVSREWNISQGQTDSRENQCFGRPIVTIGQTNINRMVPESVNMQLGLPDDGTTQHRSFCDTVEQQTITVCVSNSGQQGSSSRCHVHELGRDSCICVSTVSHHSSDPHQDSHASMQNSVDRSSLASENLVSRVASSVDSCSNISSGNSEVFNSKNQNRKLRANSPKSPNAFSSRLDVVKRSVTDRNFSQNIAEHVSKARRSSTRKVYEAKWSVFTSWCRTRKVTPSKATASNVADFLLYQFEVKKCQVSTIKGYRAMISNTLKFKSGVNVGSDPIISELMKAFELQRPVQRSLLPKWDLACVLFSLCKEPYEPLHKTSLLNLTRKLCFY